jgi:hypothetical protein
MKAEMGIINPLQYPSWNDLLLTNPGHSFFHTSNWASVLSESYHYTPRYFADIQRDKLTALIPFMEVDSMVTGKRGVSLPFTDYCDPIMSDQAAFDDVMASLIAYGKKAGWKYFELRTEHPLPREITPSSFFYGHTLDLSREEETIFSRFRDSTKRNIRKAEKEGVAVTITRSLDAVREFYRLHCMRRKDHGLPPQPYVWFRKIHDHVIAKNHGFTALASYGGNWIAGAVYCHFGDQAFYKYGASDKRYRHLRANNLVMWEAIRWCGRVGCSRFSFGRTERENKGLLQFKQGWGAREFPICYYRYDLSRNAFIRHDEPITGLHNRIFRNMPVPLLKLAGTVLYRHMG